MCLLYETIYLLHYTCSHRVYNVMIYADSTGPPDAIQKRFKGRFRGLQVLLGHRKTKGVHQQQRRRRLRVYQDEAQLGGTTPYRAESGSRFPGGHRCHGSS